MEKRHGDGDGIGRKWGFLTFFMSGTPLRLTPLGNEGGLQREPAVLAHGYRDVEREGGRHSICVSELSDGKASPQPVTSRVGEETVLPKRQALCAVDTPVAAAGPWPQAPLTPLPSMLTNKVEGTLHFTEKLVKIRCDFPS